MRNTAFLQGLDFLLNSFAVKTTFLLPLKVFLAMLLLATFGQIDTVAQSTISSSGGEDSGAGGSISYTIGQVMYSMNNGLSGSVYEGVQEPFEISIISGMEEETISLKASVYPNPSNDFLILQITDDSNPIKGKWIVTIVDVNGKLFSYQQIMTVETRIDMARLPPSTYFLRVQDSDQDCPQPIFKSFKIIKL